MEVRGTFTMGFDYNGREILGRGEMWGECDNNIDIYDVHSIHDIQGVDFEWIEDGETGQDMSELSEAIRQGILDGTFSDYDYEFVWVENEEDYEYEQSLEEQAREDYYREIAWGL